MTKSPEKKGNKETFFFCVLLNKMSLNNRRWEKQQHTVDEHSNSNHI